MPGGILPGTDQFEEAHEHLVAVGPSELLFVHHLVVDGAKVAHLNAESLPPVSGPLLVVLLFSHDLILRQSNPRGHQYLAGLVLLPVGGIMSQGTIGNVVVVYALVVSAYRILAHGEPICVLVILVA